MDILRSVISAIKSILGSIRSAENSCGNLPASFPLFSELPVELRLRIWELALIPRVVPIHLTTYSSDTDSDILVEEDEENDESEDNTAGDNNDEPEDVSDEANSRHSVDKSPMVVTTCTLKGVCGCQYLPPWSPTRVASPAVLFVCRESYRAVARHYSTRFGNVYNLEGQVMGPPSCFQDSRFLRADTKTFDPARIGVYLNPAIDTLKLRFKIPSWQAVTCLHQFVTIAAREASDIRSVVLDIIIVLRPFQWWQRTRFQKWRNWGNTGRWVPKDVVNFRRLKEVVLVLGQVERQMLPAQWRERTEMLWEEQLKEMSSQWPAEWNGVMPVLRFVENDTY